MSNFNPNFDREKLAFLELANRGNGLDSISYMYCKSGSFENILTAIIKGGTAELYMLYAHGIDVKYLEVLQLKAGDIKANTIEVNTITSDTINNTGSITTYDLQVEHKFEVGFDENKPGLATIYGPFEVLLGPASFDVAFLTAICGTLTSFATPLFTVNAPDVAINAIESLAPGLVQLYGGTSISISAPAVNIGRIVSATLGTNTDIININSLISNTISSPTIEIGGDTLSVTETISFAVMAPSITLSAATGMILDAPTITITGEIFSITETGNINLFSDTIIGLTGDEISLAGVTNASIDAPTITIEGVQVNIGGTDGINIGGLSNTPIITMHALTNINISSDDTMTIEGITQLDIGSLGGINVGRVDTAQVNITATNFIKVKSNSITVDGDNLTITAVVTLFQNAPKILLSSDTGTIQIDKAGVTITGGMLVDGLGISCQGAIQFGGRVTFKAQADASGTYSWPSPPKAVPLSPGGETIGPMLSSVGGELKWVFAKLLHISGGEVPHHLTCAEGETGVLFWHSLQVIPAINGRYIIGPFLTCIDGLLKWTTNTFTVVLPVLSILDEENRITIDEKQYEVPPYEGNA